MPNRATFWHPELSIPVSLWKSAERRSERNHWRTWPIGTVPCVKKILWVHVGCHFQICGHVHALLHLWPQKISLAFFPLGGGMQHVVNSCKGYPLPWALLGVCGSSPNTQVHRWMTWKPIALEALSSAGFTEIDLTRKPDCDARWEEKMVRETCPEKKLAIKWHAMLLDFSAVQGSATLQFWTFQKEKEKRKACIRQIWLLNCSSTALCPCKQYSCVCWFFFLFFCARANLLPRQFSLVRVLGDTSVVWRSVNSWKTMINRESCEWRDTQPDCSDYCPGSCQSVPLQVLKRPAQMRPVFFYGRPNDNSLCQQKI